MVLTINGETHTLTEWAKITNLHDVIEMRAMRGWTDEVIFTPERERQKASRPSPDKPTVDLPPRDFLDSLDRVA